MSNTLRCEQCTYYDPLLGSNRKNTGMGWCAKKSIYPHQEGPGQIFPQNVTRVMLGELARPFIVKKDDVISPCEYARQSSNDAVETKCQRLLTQIKLTNRNILI